MRGSVPFWAVLSLMLSMAVLSCGDRSDQEPAALSGKPSSVSLEDVDPSGQTVIFWYQHTREREQALKELIRAFNRTNPFRIKVRGEYAGGYGDIYNKMIVGIRSGMVPNLVVAYQNQAMAYALAGALTDVQPYVDSPKWGFSPEELADFFPGFLKQDWSPQLGMRLGFPPNRSMEVLYYNVDWLKELGYSRPPETWEEFREMACKAVRQSFSRASHPTSSMGYQFSVDTSRFASMLFSRGGDLTNTDLSAYTLNTPEARETLRYLRDLFGKGCATFVAEQYSDQADFGAGNLLFTIASTSGLPFYRDVVQDGAQFNWAIALLPHTTPEPVQDIYGASLSIPKSTAEKQLAAWVFLKWMTEPAQQAHWARVSNYFPVRKSTAAGLEEYFAQHPNYRIAFEWLQYGKAEPPVAGYDVVRDMIEKAIVAVLKGADVDQTLADLERRANENLKAYR